MASSPKHPQVHIKHGDREAEVDEAIADLILACWRHDVGTVNSCQQGVGGWAWIQFEFSVDAERFLQKVITDNDDPMYEQATSIDWGGRGEVEKQNWQWSMNVEDLSWVWNDNDEMEYHGPSQFSLSPSVRFPPEQLAELVRRLSG